jgi:hypothetical protein
MFNQRVLSIADAVTKIPFSLWMEPVPSLANWLHQDFRRLGATMTEIAKPY